MLEGTLDGFFLNFESNSLGCITMAVGDKNGRDLKKKKTKRNRQTSRLKVYLGKATVDCLISL